jgi:inositol-phosphate phosphatase/L-galactose 1-phosphate phosphatase
VTETDKACEELILGRLRAAFPAHCFIGEEETAAAGGVLPAITDAPTWMVDPLDGTTNFVHRFPFSCVCVGLAVGKQPVVGVVHCPILKETFHAARGKGAFLNGERIEVSRTSEAQKALVATEIGVARDPAVMDNIMRRVRAVCESSRSLRCSGSCAMNMVGVACGRLDAFYEDGFGGPWDCAAGAVIVREAGGEVSDVDGGDFDLAARRVLATNGQALRAAYGKMLA